MFEQDLFSALSQHAGVSGMVGTRIYPLLIPEKSPVPAITYTRIHSQNPQTLEGDNSLTNAHVQIDCWAKTYIDAKSLKLQVQDAMSKATAFQALSQFDQDAYDPDTHEYRVIIQFSCWFYE